MVNLVSFIFGKFSVFILGIQTIRTNHSQAPLPTAHASNSKIGLLLQVINRRNRRGPRKRMNRCCCFHCWFREWMQVSAHAHYGWLPSHSPRKGKFHRVWCRFQTHCNLICSILISRNDKRYKTYHSDKAIRFILPHRVAHWYGRYTRSISMHQHTSFFG